MKRSVDELRQHSVLTKVNPLATSQDDCLTVKKSFSRNVEAIDVFVHGFVYDEATNEVHDLNVSFGPPGKPIPHVPFKAIAAAKNFHRDSSRPGVFKGKTWDFVHHHA